MSKKALTAGDVLGFVSKPKKLSQKVGIDDIDFDRVKSLPLSGGNVAWVICLGCGMMPSVHKQGAERLAQMAGQQIPSLGEKYCFVAEKCALCDEDYKGVVLKKID